MYKMLFSFMLLILYVSIQQVYAMEKSNDETTGKLLKLAEQKQLLVNEIYDFCDPKTLFAILISHTSLQKSIGKYFREPQADKFQSINNLTFFMKNKELPLQNLNLKTEIPIILKLKLADEKLKVKCYKTYAKDSAWGSGDVRTCDLHFYLGENNVHVLPQTRSPFNEPIEYIKYLQYKKEDENGIEVLKVENNKLSLLEEKENPIFGSMTVDFLYTPNIGDEIISLNDIVLVPEGIMCGWECNFPKGHKFKVVKIWTPLDACVRKKFFERQFIVADMNGKEPDCQIPQRFYSNFKCIKKNVTNMEEPETKL